MITVIHNYDDHGPYSWAYSDGERVVNPLYPSGKTAPNYPLPAIRAMVNNAQRLIIFGEITAENGFDLSTVFERFVKLK